MDTIHVAEFDGRKIWIRKFGEEKVLLTTADTGIKGMMAKIMLKRKDDTVETLVSLEEMCPEDLDGVASFIVDPERVQLIIDMRTNSFSVLIMTPEEEGELG